MDNSETLSNKMERENISVPDQAIVQKYEASKGKSWWETIISNVDNWHRRIDLLLKISVSAVIVYLLWKWISFVMEVMQSADTLRLSPSVHISLVTGTSVNLIGLLAIMAKYLCPQKEKK